MGNTPSTPVIDTPAFLKAVEKAAFDYLATGDQVYTREGKTLVDMYARFDNDPDKLVLDFAKWFVATKARGC